MAKKNQSILVQEIPVAITTHDDQDYICLTDMAKARTDSARAADVIKNWIRTRTTLEFLGTWERIYNPNFKVVEFDHFKSGQKETPGPLNRKRPRKGSQGQRYQNRLVGWVSQTFSKWIHRSGIGGKPSHSAFITQHSSFAAGVSLEGLGYGK